MTSPGLQLLVGRRPIEAGARRDQAIVEGEPALDLLDAQSLGQLLLGLARRALGEDDVHALDHALGRKLEVLDLLGRLDRAQAFEREERIDDVDVGQPLPQHLVGIGGQERRLDADPAHAGAELADVLDDALHGVGAGPGGEIEALRPELAELLLVGLHAVADIGGALGLALLVDDGRQIAADADGIHGLEEEEFVVAEQVLHVVLGGGDEHVDAGLVQEPVELLGIEWNRFANICLCHCHARSPWIRRRSCTPRSKLHHVSTIVPGAKGRRQIADQVNAKFGSSPNR